MPLRRPIPEPLPRYGTESPAETGEAHRVELGSPREPERASSLSYQIRESGAISVYGLGGAPVTLSYEQWRQLLAHAEQLRVFLEEQRSHFAVSDTELQSKGEQS